MALKLDSRFRGNDKITSLIGLLLIVFAAALIFIPIPASAGILPACSATGACQVCDVVNVFVTLGKWLMVSAGGLALLVITWAAFGLVSSAGNPEKITGAKKQITGAILGVGITLAAFQLVSLLIATLAVPSGNQGFAGQTSEQTGKFASLSGFLGIPWWEICNVKELRKLGATKQTDITYKGTGVCRYWGDGTPCQEISEEREKKLIECGYLEGNADLTPEEKEKQEKECQAAQEKILRCCQGACSDKECITKKISRPIAQSSTAYQGQATMLARPGTLSGTAQWKEKILKASRDHGLDPCVLTVIVTKESTGDPDAIGYDISKNPVPGEGLNKTSGDNFFGLIGLRGDSNRAVCKTGCSRGIGLTQITVFPNRNDWLNDSTPARPLGGQKYKIDALLVPEISLNLAADLFIYNRDNMATTWQRFKMSDDLRIEYAFAGYNGGIGNLNKLIKTINQDENRQKDFDKTDTYKNMTAYMRDSLFRYNTCKAGEM